MDERLRPGRVGKGWKGAKRKEGRLAEDYGEKNKQEMVLWECQQLALYSFLTEDIVAHVEGGLRACLISLPPHPLTICIPLNLHPASPFN